ncbi:MAG: hypothetical protein V3U76_13895 [Granulosicoccus sp.]
MKITTDQLRKLLAIAILALMAACGPAELPDLVTGADGQTRVGLGIPPPVMQVRSLDRSQLLPRVNISQADNATPVSTVELQRQGDQWVGRFSLPDNGVYILDIAWFYTVGGRQIQLAAAPRKSISLASDRNISISSYDTDFDEDSDGVSNVDELKQDRDPLVSGAGSQTTPLPVPNDQQGDCREADVAGGQLSSFFQLRDAAAQSFSIPTAIGQTAIFEVYYLEVPGTLTIEHVSGDPAVTQATLFDLELNLALRFFDASEDGRAERAIVSASLDAGIYCYWLSDPAAEKTPLTEIIIRNSFVPR